MPRLHMLSHGKTTHNVQLRLFDPAGTCSGTCSAADIDARHPEDADGARVISVTLSARASSALLDRSPSSSDDDLSEVLETIIDSYLRVMYAYAHESNFEREQVLALYHATYGVENLAEEVRAVGSFADYMRACLTSEYMSELTGEIAPEFYWSRSHRALLGRLDDLSAAGEAALLDRILVVNHS